MSVFVWLLILAVVLILDYAIAGWFYEVAEAKGMP